jgi:glycogen(starch) synthase
MKILLLTTEFPPDRPIGGVGSYVARLASGLSDEGADVTVLHLGAERTRTEEWAGTLVIRESVPSRRVRLPKLPFASGRISLALWTRDAVRRLPTEFDVIDAPSWGNLNLLLPRRAASLVVSTLVTPVCMAVGRDGSKYGLDCRIADALERWSVRRSMLAVADSEQHRAELRQRNWLKGTPTEIVWLPVQNTTGPLRQPARPAVVLQVGRIEPRKNLHSTVEAAGLLAKRGLDVKVVSVGLAVDGPYGAFHTYRAYVDTIAKERHVSVTHLGQLDDAALADVRAMASVVIQPSAYESFGLAAAEALAAGCPVVVSDRCGIAEVVGNAVCARVVPVGDSHAVAEAVADLLGADRKSLAEAARQLACTRLSPLVIARQRLELYQRHLSSSPQR